LAFRRLVRIALPALPPLRLEPLAEARELRGFDLTQEEFARRIGITQGHLSALERGAKEAGASVLLAISREFGVSVDWLLTGQVHKKMTPPRSVAPGSKIFLANKKRIRYYVQWRWLALAPWHERRQTVDSLEYTLATSGRGPLVVESTEPLGGRKFICATRLHEDVHPGCASSASPTTPFPRDFEKEAGSSKGEFNPGALNKS
jgi:transcriptional regulator with XRE-family HTH domain